MSYREYNPETVRFRSTRLACDGFGFSVQIREFLGPGGGSTGRRGIGVFCFSYRPLQSERRSTISFKQDPEHLLVPDQNRIALLLPPDRPCAWSWENGLGRMATFCFTPRFSEAVLAGAGLPIRPLYGFPPPSFAINYQVEGLCRLLMEETERGWVLVHALVIERGSVFLVHSLELLCRLSRSDLFFVAGSAFPNYRMFCLSELVTQNHGKLSRDWIQGRRGRISVTQEQL